MDSMAIDRETGPSWARPNWPVATLDANNLGLDPTEATIAEIGEAAQAIASAAGVTDEAAIRRAADDSIRAMMLVRLYRVRGHLAAKLDPLGLSHHDFPYELTPACHGFADTDLDRKIWLGGVLGFDVASIREMVAVLTANYCGTVGREMPAHAVQPDQHHRADRIVGGAADRGFVGHAGGGRG